MSKRAEERGLETLPPRWRKTKDGIGKVDSALPVRKFWIRGYEQAEKDIKEAIIKHFKYKQDHSPEHTLHWWVYKNVIDKVNEL